MSDKQCRPDQMPHSAASDLGLHCLQRPVCPNSSGYYGIQSHYAIASLYLELELI